MARAVTADDFFRVKSDVNGNSRFALRYMFLLEGDEWSLPSSEAFALALRRAHVVGGKKYRSKHEPNSAVVFQCYEGLLSSLAAQLNKVVMEG